MTLSWTQTAGRTRRSWTLVARLGGTRYARQGEVFEIARPKV